MLSDDKNNPADKQLAILLLGSNLGDSIAQLHWAVRQLGESTQISVDRVSNLYKTAPQGVTDQPDFINAAVAITTTYSPHELLDITQQIEHQAGRVRHTHWGPRTLDIDIIDYAGIELNTPRLILPHPRSHLRAFVILPVLEIAPTLVIQNKTIDEYLDNLSDQRCEVLSVSQQQAND